MASEAFLPLGAAYAGASQSALEKAKADAGSAYFPSVFNPATASQKGHVVVGKHRVSSWKDGAYQDGFKLYYEVHGSGPVHVVFVMGLNNPSFGWLPQVEHFSTNPKYSCLVFDNRGVGNSETPTGLFKTSEMALDTFELLDMLGWTKKRDVHLIGVSMGGMISLEMARQRPELLASLSLISTAPGRRYGTPLYGLTSLTRVLGGRVLGIDNEQYRLNRIISMLFPQPWLAEKSTKDPRGRTNQQVLYDMYKWRFQFTTPQKLRGALSQMKAALTHNITDADLAKINTSVPKICIFTGDTDYLVDPRNSEYLKQHIPNAEFQKFPNAGHALGNQIADILNQLLERVIAEGIATVEKGAW